MCAHDITYQRQNEACAGVGCPKCRADVAARVVARLEQEAITNAVKQEIRERMTLTDADIAEMQVRCDETNSAEQYSTATEGHW